MSRSSEFHRISEAMTAIITEYQRATEAHGAFASAHEGYAVILEELDELWIEVKRRHKDLPAMRKEAIQVGAMAMRFLVDVCTGEEAKPDA